jgi:para-aminobenzoate synthetase component 2
MILIIDNYDSFVFNLARYIEELGKPTQVVRNNQLRLSDISKLKPSHIILSPGPCGPDEAGICQDVVKDFAEKIPILGVCLGHQVIGQVYGGKVTRAKKPMHGKASDIHHDGRGIFTGIPNPLRVGRYHSLIVEDTTLDGSIKVTSHSAEGEIMSLASLSNRVIGLQFHPESVLTEYGYQLLDNFIQV